MADGVVVIGGGPAGLAAAIRLRRMGLGRITILERDREAGGIPRHSAHTGFGIRDLRRLCSGPRYAARYRDAARRAGVEVVTEAMATDWTGDGRLRLTGPAGRTELDPAAVVLATGCRERPRAARLVPGARPGGVMTTSTLQQLVHGHGEHIDGRGLIVGAEHVSFSAAATLAHGGASVTALVTELGRHQSLAAFRAGAMIRYRAPVWTRTKVTAIRGGERVEAVDLVDLDSGSSRTVACELVVFTADWIPDHELAVMAGCALDAGTRGPSIDAGLRTSRPGIFAAGNVLHPAETADVAALDGVHVAGSVRDFLRSGEWPKQIPIRVRSPLTWISPNLVEAGADNSPARARFLLRSSAFLRAPAIEARQAGRALWRGRLRRLAPGRSAHIPATWMPTVDPGAGPVVVRIADGEDRAEEER
jgi:thioredoxin reductase